MIPMPVLRSRPWTQPIDSLHREIDRLFNLMEPDSNGGSAAAAHPCDIKEDEETITIDAELPGFTRDQVDVTLDAGVLSIVAERREEPESKTDRTHLKERRYTRVARSFTLPAKVDASNVEATLREGVLHLRLHKTAESTAKKIGIQ